MGLDMRMVALGDMGRMAYECEWRGNHPILSIVKFVGKEIPYDYEMGYDPITLSSEDIPYDYGRGNSPTTLSSEDLKCIVGILNNKHLALHLYNEAGDDDYYKDIIKPIADEFEAALGLSEEECLDFLFYATY